MDKLDLFTLIIMELDYYYDKRKQVCFPIGYPDMLIYAVHCAANGTYEEAYSAIRRIRKSREST